MAFASDPELLVLHALRLRGFAEPDVVAARFALPVGEVTVLLERFEQEGLVVHRSGRLAGWTLTAKGRAEGETAAAAELDRAGTRHVVTAAYERFLALNPEVLQLCTDWQMRDLDGLVINDHSDAGYDAAVVKRLEDLDADAQPVCAHLAGALDRLGGYGDRLAAAVDRVRDGDIDWFTKPSIDSYHTVWFELHEDLLATLGRERGEETG